MSFCRVAFYIILQSWCLFVLSVILSVIMVFLLLCKVSFCQMYRCQTPCGKAIFRVLSEQWQHKDTLHIDIQHDDTQLSLVHVEHHFNDCHFAECQFPEFCDSNFRLCKVWSCSFCCYAKCHFAECAGARLVDSLQYISLHSCLPSFLCIDELT